MIKVVHSLLIAVLLCTLLPSSSKALSRVGPGPTLYDYLDGAELVVVGRFVKVKAIDKNGVFETDLILVNLENAQYIDREGVKEFSKPVYLYLKSENDVIWTFKACIYFEMTRSLWINLINQMLRERRKHWNNRASA